jgi:hypothetical protein
MNLDLVSNLPFNDARALSDFMLVHRLVHLETANALSQQFKVPASTVGIEAQAAEDAWIRLMADKKAPKNPTALRTWLDLHQQIHLATYELLGGDQSSSPDLSQVDFSNESEFYDWLQVHQEVHDYEQSTLGIM